MRYVSTKRNREQGCAGVVRQYSLKYILVFPTVCPLKMRISINSGGSSHLLSALLAPWL